MTDWTDTAKRMAAHPKWKWCEGMQYRAISAEDPLGRKETTLRIPPGHNEPLEHLRGTAYPDLTDWATAGIVFGMVLNSKTFVVIQRITQDTYERSDGSYGSYWLVEALTPVETNVKFGHTGDQLGQALGELWLELVG